MGLKKLQLKKPQHQEDLLLLKKLQLKEDLLLLKKSQVKEDLLLKRQLKEDLLLKLQLKEDLLLLKNSVQRQEDPLVCYKILKMMEMETASLLSRTNRNITTLKNNVKIWVLF